MEGWILLHRSCLDHWLYTEYRPLTRREAWETMLFTVNYADGKLPIHGIFYECKRGQALLSIESWAKKFNWTIQQVRTFFKLLEKDEMITIEGLQYTTRLTIVNYDKYQPEVKINGNVNNQKHLKTTNKNNNYSDNYENEQQPNNESNNEPPTNGQRTANDNIIKSNKNKRKEEESFSPPVGASDSSSEKKPIREYLLKKYPKVLKFYETEFKENEGKQFLKEYKRLVFYIVKDNPLGKPCDAILEIENQISFKNYLVLRNGARENMKKVVDYIDIIVNSPNYIKGKQSVFMTLQNFIDKG